MKKKTTFKTKMINFLDRRKHSTTENLRLVAIVPLILILVGLFQPLIGVSTGFYVSDSRGETTTTNPLWKPTENVVEFSAGDFVFHKSLRELRIFGTKIGDIEFLGINLYDFLTTPLPNFDGVHEVGSFLDSGALAFLVDENFVNFCNSNLGDFGVGLIEFGRVLNDIANQASEVIKNISDALTNINNASIQIRSTVSQIESYLNIADWIFIMASIILVAMIVLFILGKGPKVLPKIIFTFFIAIMIISGIAVAIGNSIIASALASGMRDLGASIISLLNNFAPGVLDFLTGVFGIDDIRLVIELVIFCGSGWWLAIVALLILTILSYLVPALEKKKVQSNQIISQEDKQ